MKSIHIAIPAALFLSLLIFSDAAAAGEWISGSASSASGSRDYALWVPSGYQNRDKPKPGSPSGQPRWGGNSLPLVMMLHGCMHKPRDLAAISGMNDEADKNTFLVVYPEQTKEANPLRCWNWFDANHQTRELCEPSLLAAIVLKVASTHNIDPRRVYVAGISAGAAMAVVMGATYPDLFSGVGVMAGLAFKAGTTAETGLTAMKQGGPDPKQQGLLAFKVMGNKISGKSIRRVPVIVFHGDADPYLSPINADQVIAQWAKTNDYLDDGIDNDSVKSEPAETIAGSVPAGHSYTRYVYNDRSHRLLMEKWIVKGLSHAWSGATAVTPFADPKGPHASEEMWRFFRKTSRATAHRRRRISHR